MFFATVFLVLCKAKFYFISYKYAKKLTGLLAGETHKSNYLMMMMFWLGKNYDFLKNRKKYYVMTFSLF